MDFYTPSIAEKERRSFADKSIHRAGPELLIAPVVRLDHYRSIEEPEPSLTGFLDIIGEHRELFLTVLLVVLALGGAYIFGSPKKYVSTMELLVTNARSTSVI